MKLTLSLAVAAAMCDTIAQLIDQLRAAAAEL